MDKLIVPVVDVQEVSDGHHTFRELYEHRHALLVSLMNSHPDISWKSCEHGDGSPMYLGWIIAGMHLPTGDISYHLPSHYWHRLKAKEVIGGVPYDGHTSQDVVKRLLAWTP